MALSAAGLSVALAEEAVAAAPSGLCHSTLRAAVLMAAGEGLTTGLTSSRVLGLVDQALHTMRFAHTKALAPLLLVTAGVATGMAVVLGQPIGASKLPQPPASRPGQRSGRRAGADWRQPAR